MAEVPGGGVWLPQSEFDRLGEERHKLFEAIGWNEQQRFVQAQEIDRLRRGWADAEATIAVLQSRMRDLETEIDRLSDSRMEEYRP